MVTYKKRNIFSDYFNNKIVEIRLRLHAARECITPPRQTRCFVTPVDTFTPTSAIVTRTCKTCMLGPLPSDLVKQDIDTLAIIVADVTNACLAEGIMPTELKQALVHPLLKKQLLCKDTK